FYTPSDLAAIQPVPSTIPPPAGTTGVPFRTLGFALAAGSNLAVTRGGTPVTPDTVATLLATNVVHFTVRVLTNSATINPGGEFADLPLNTPIDGNAANDFDSALAPTYTNPGPYQILALQIIIRVWDQKTQQSRQITIVQDL